MSTVPSFVIVGGGRAGAYAIDELRARGFGGQIRLVAAEHHIPYDHPPLSKDYLTGDGGLDGVYLHPKEWYAERDVLLMTGVSANELDAASKSLRLSNGQTVSYERLLLATGSRAQSLGIAGEDASGVYSLRTLDDARALRTALADGGRRVVVIGSGWIGMELSASARSLGNEVTVLGHGTVPLSSAVGDEIGRYIAGVHERHGVVIRMSTGATEIVTARGIAGGVRLEGGEVVDADIVIVAVGATPNVELAGAAGLDLDNGILTDSSLQTSVPGVFAAGDVANAFHPVLGRRLRTEHWANASDQGVVAARSMLGEAASFEAIPYFFTDQFDLGMEYSGFPTLARDARLIYRGDLEGGEFMAFWVDGDRHIVAGMNVNVWDVNERVQQLIREAKPVDLDRLADAAASLESL